MCGISGLVNTKTYNENDVKKMISCIAHRGPDEQDVINLGKCILGHARLAVVDLENGKQPMSNQDDSVWVVFNGEIYNFVELRADLIAKGYVFKSRCDTEVLVHLWREKGPKMLDDLIGMFAFCIWDSKYEKGIIARDRQGIKPCYIMNIDGGLAFASEIKSLLTLKNYNPEIDDTSLNLVHSFNYCPPPRTCYRGITQLEPGSYIEIGDKNYFGKKKYWNWSFAGEKENISFDTFASLLDDSIKMQLRFDVKGCLFLSSGVDSSILAAHLSKYHNSSNLIAYSLDNNVSNYSEYSEAKKIADQFNFELRKVRYDFNIVPNKIDEVIYHTDQPHGDFSFFLINLLCDQASKDGHIVAFNGDGPDEIMNGFSHNELYLNNHHSETLLHEKYFDIISFMPEGIKRRILNEDFYLKGNLGHETFQEMMEPFKKLKSNDQIAAYESIYLAQGNNLIKTDRMGAGKSIEGRSPYLDHRITELMAKMSNNQKFSKTYSKYFLKEYGLKFFEKDQMFKKKSMPTMPIGEWIKGPLKDWAIASLEGLDKSRYNVKESLSLLNEHCSGIYDHTRSLRTLLITSAWMSQKPNKH